jgi:hypothetical protein
MAVHASHLSIGRSAPRYVAPSARIAFGQLFELDPGGLRSRRAIVIGHAIVPAGMRVPASLDLGGIRLCDLLECVLEVDESGPLVLIVGYYPS